MKEYLLDTDICIYLIKNRPKRIRSIFKKLKPSQIFISSITLAELEYGVFKSQFPQQNQITLSSFLSAINILYFDDESAGIYGKIRADLEKKGKVIGPYDLQIAAQALSRNLTLITNNVREFERIDILRIENWLSK